MTAIDGSENRMGMQAKAYTVEGQPSGMVDLPEQIFGREPSQPALYQAVKAYLTNRRQGTASAKNRSAVESISGAKPWRQKGTGRARAGTYSSPLFTGGGIIFGPQPRDHREHLPKKLKRLAIFSAFSLRAREDRVTVVDDLAFEEPKTKGVVHLLAAMGIPEGERVLLLSGPVSEAVARSCRNIQGLQVKLSQNACAYDILRAEQLILTRSGLTRIQEVWGR